MNSNTNNYLPALALYHANAKGTGCAIKMTLNSATKSEDGYIWLEMSKQMTVGNRMEENPIFPKFDWDNSISAKLDFKDLCLILEVLRGIEENMNCGKGVFKRTACGLTVVNFRHVIEPVPGYSLELSNKLTSDDEVRRMRFLMSNSEALGICEAITGSMRLVVFGE